MVRVLACIGLVAVAGLAGCTAFTPNHKDVLPVVGPAPRLNTTPMEPALACLRSQLKNSRRDRDLRVGVNDFVDGTGVMEGGTQYSHALSQRPDMMLVVALASAGAHLVNRSSVNVAEWEMKQAMEKKLGDGRKETVDGQSVTFRPIHTGVILGSTDYVSGAITELNWNISSGVAEAGAYSAGIGKRTYRISLAIDVMVTNTQTTEIVYAKSYKKQLVGFETNANFFRFVNQDSALQIVTLGNAAASTATQALELFNANLGEKQNEPTQVALRWAVELAAYDIMRKLTHAGQSCDILLPREKIDDDVLHPKTVTASAASPALPVKSARTSADDVVYEPEASAEPDSNAASAAPPARPAAVAPAKHAAAEPEASMAPESNVASAAPPVRHVTVAPPKQVAAEPKSRWRRKSKVASVAPPATPRDGRPAHAGGGRAESLDGAEFESCQRRAAGYARRRPPRRNRRRQSRKRPMAGNSKVASTKVQASKKKPVVEARAKAAAPQQTAAKQPAATEPSNKNTQAQAQSSYVGELHWMNGSVRALKPEWSRVGQAGDAQ